MLATWTSNFEGRNIMVVGTNSVLGSPRAYRLPGEPKCWYMTINPKVLKMVVLPASWMEKSVTFSLLGCGSRWPWTSPELAADSQPDRQVGEILALEYLGVDGRNPDGAPEDRFSDETVVLVVPVNVRLTCHDVRQPKALLESVANELQLDNAAGHLVQRCYLFGCSKGSQDGALTPLVSCWIAMFSSSCRRLAPGVLLRGNYKGGPRSGPAP